MGYYIEEDEIVSTDMYLKQCHFGDVEESDELDLHISRYNTPQIDRGQTFELGPWNDNAHVVFDVPNLTGISRW